MTDIEAALQVAAASLPWAEAGVWMPAGLRVAAASLPWTGPGAWTPAGLRVAAASLPWAVPVGWRPAGLRVVVLSSQVETRAVAGPAAAPVAWMAASSGEQMRFLLLQQLVLARL